MNPVQQQIDVEFRAMQSLQDLYAVLNFVCQQEAVLKQGFPPKVTKSVLNYCLFTKNAKYKTYHIPKKGPNKPLREIQAPKEVLKQIQRVLNYCLQEVFKPKEPAHGFVKERNIVSNASAHVGRTFVYNLDLENFFPSIHFGRVRGVFSKAPFNFNPDLAKMLANLCCYEGKLPQGAPTSPVISNLVCRSLDSKLVHLANRYKIKYSRYADDITFSANKNVFENEAFQQELQVIITGEGFLINQEKVRLQPNKERQMVTGLVVNKKVNITSKFKRELRWMIHLCEKHGLEAAQNWLDKNYSFRHRYNGKVPRIGQVIEGHLNFMKMVVGEKSNYLVLKNKAANVSSIISVENPSRPSSFPQKVSRVPDGLKYLVDNNLWEDSLSIRKVTDTLHRKINHNPIRQSAYLSRFRRQEEFRRIVHTLVDDSDTIAEVALSSKNAWRELEKEMDNYDKMLRHELGIQINNFINKLMSKTYKQGNESYNMFFDQNSDNFIHPFTRLFRIGVSKHEIPLSKILDAAKQELREDIRIEMADKLTSEFSIRTSTLNLYFGIKQILIAAKKNTIKVKASRLGNKKTLQLIDIDSNYNSLTLDDQGGDLNNLKSILWSLCDLNIIWKTDNNKKYEQQILPPSIPVSFDDDVLGFTYELIFPNYPRKALLIDDDTSSSRWTAMNALVNTYSDYLVFSHRLPHDWEENYNWVFIHQNYSDGIDSYKARAEALGIEFWRFSGGLGHYEIDEHHRIISYDRLLNHIESFCKYLKAEGESFYPEQYPKKLSDFFKKSAKPLIKLKDSILLGIRDRQLNYPNLDEQSYTKIRELAENSGCKGSNIPNKFYNNDELIEFMENCISNL